MIPKRNQPSNLSYQTPCDINLVNTAAHLNSVQRKTAAVVMVITLIFVIRLNNTGMTPFNFRQLGTPGEVTAGLFRT